MWGKSTSEAFLTLPVAHARHAGIDLNSWCTDTGKKTRSGKRAAEETAAGGSGSVIAPVKPTADSSLPAAAPTEAPLRANGLPPEPAAAQEQAPVAPLSGLTRDWGADSDVDITDTGEAPTAAAAQLQGGPAQQGDHLAVWRVPQPQSPPDIAGFQAAVSGMKSREEILAHPGPAEDPCKEPALPDRGASAVAAAAAQPDSAAETGRLKKRLRLNPIKQPSDKGVAPNGSNARVQRFRQEVLSGFPEEEAAVDPFMCTMLEHWRTQLSAPPALIQPQQAALPAADPSAAAAQLCESGKAAMAAAASSAQPAAIHDVEAAGSGAATAKGTAVPAHLAPLPSGQKWWHQVRHYCILVLLLLADSTLLSSPFRGGGHHLAAGDEGCAGCQGSSKNAGKMCWLKNSFTAISLGCSDLSDCCPSWCK